MIQQDNTGLTEGQLVVATDIGVVAMDPHQDRVVGMLLLQDQTKSH